jgi:3-methylcrotonyl-CoA carboxylase alpha subunit
MFRTLLIANRGEIALRIIRTARAMGLRTVAVHSDADRDAAHVAAADMAVPIGPAPATQSYLDGAAILLAARASGAEAIHPGYGFLSENPDFAEAVAAAGLVFVGPSAAAIRAMGLKDAAKARMAAAGVPVVPGWQGESQDPEHLAGAAEALGYPVLIKAVAGGGGKGMRRVEDPADFAAALASARAEAAAAFGNASVLIEKWIAAPRHIEVQVMGDGTRAVHLFERDCSLQRRHQKVIEEAPAPGMTEAMRAAMGQAAVRAAEAIGYAGAGTVEFIVDASEGLRPDRFWFMEMNTRLQVEHPVTEAITGIDLVEWQLRIAAGEPLPLRQDQIAITGHAVEARLYAEDVPAGFLPATGRIAHLAFPQGVRADSGVRAGDAITPWYDPMIAKIIAHGPDRAQALGRIARALDETEVAGTVTNLPFLRALARHPGFVAGEIDTGLIARDIATLAAPEEPGPAARVAAVLAAAGLWEGAAPHAGFALWAPLARDIDLLHAGRPLGAVLRLMDPDRAEVTLGGARHLAERRGGVWWIDGARAALRVVRAGAMIHLPGPGGGSFEIPDPLARSSGAGAGGDVARAPMPGVVRAVHVAPGEAVAAGARLATLEAMKMEHAALAPRAGIVAEVMVDPGAQVEAGAPLVRLAPEGPADG